MNSNNKLSLHERADLINGLMCGFTERIAWLLSASGQLYHDLNAKAYSLFKKHGIKWSKNDFLMSEKCEKAITEIWNKLNQENRDRGLSYDCFRLATYFLCLADMINIVEKTTDWKQMKEKHESI